MSQFKVGMGYKCWRDPKSGAVKMEEQTEGGVSWEAFLEMLYFVGLGLAALVVCMNVPSPRPGKWREHEMGDYF